MDFGKTWYTCNLLKSGFVWISNWVFHFILNGKTARYWCSFQKTKLKTFPQIGTRFVHFIERQRFSLFMYCIIVGMWWVSTFSKYLLKQIRSSYFFSKYLHKSIFSSGFVLNLFGLFCWPKHEMKRDRSVWHKTWTFHGVWTHLRAERVETIAKVRNTTN